VNFCPTKKSTCRPKIGGRFCFFEKWGFCKEEWGGVGVGGGGGGGVCGFGGCGCCFGGGGVGGGGGIILNAKSIVIQRSGKIRKRFVL